ncbi:MAG: chloramphenicol acetyltransferase [Bacteroidetes bacterium HGW-Bacteroidetes-22]|nr:MAG: chloramphenicol acetyltransferase [Bacteroidetes bacterium HGW-Bacteroidetes-22]
MKTRIDINTWNRKEHYAFFCQFTDPFWGVTIMVDVTRAYEIAKLRKIPFSLWYLYLSMKAANMMPSFRYRIEGDEVFLYDAIHAGPTIARADGTFGFAFIRYQNTWEAFYTDATTEVERVKKGSDLWAEVNEPNIIHVSTVTKLHFTSLRHARHFELKDCCPKITFGQVKETDGKRLMPVSLHMHHALADGADGGNFFELYQQLLNT